MGVGNSSTGKQDFFYCTQATTCSDWTTVTEPHQEKSAVFFKLYPPEDQFEKKYFLFKIN